MREKTKFGQQSTEFYSWLNSDDNYVEVVHKIFKD